MTPARVDHTVLSGLLAAIDRHRLLFAVALFVLHVSCKAPGIGKRSIWLDEAATILSARQPVSEIVAWSRRDQNPPLYTIAMRPWIAVFGDSESAARWPYVLASAMTASALFLIVRRFLGIESAVYASLLFATSEPQFYYAREARAYALLGLLCTLSFGLFLATLERARWSTALALGVLNAVAAYTHFTVILAFLAQLVAAVAVVRIRQRGVARYAVGQVVAIVLFAPWMGALVSNLPRPGRFWLDPPDFTVLRNVVIELAGGWMAATAGCIVLAAAAILTKRRRAPGAVPDDLVPGLAVAAWAFVPIVLGFALSQRFPAFGLRYQLLSSLGWFVLLGWAIARMPAGATIRAILACALAAIAATQMDPSKSRSVDWRALVKLADPAAGSAVIVAPEWQCLPFSYYFDRGTFRDEPKRVQRLAEGRVHCIQQVTDIDSGDILESLNVTVLQTKGLPENFAPSLFDRLARAGFARVSSRPFPGGVAVQLRRMAPPHRAAS